MTTGLKHELYLNGAWRDISPDVRQAQETTISRGLSGEALGGQASPGQCTFTIDNRAGTYSPRNPAGTWYGYLGRNTPHRVSVDAVESHLLVLPQTAASASVPDSAALSVAGDLEIRADVRLDSWRHAQDLVHKWNTTGNQRSFTFGVTAAGFLTFAYSAAGSTTTGTDTSTAVVPPHTGRLSIRVVFDANNGAGGRTTTFYTSTDQGLGGTWTQLGADVVTGTTASIFNSTAAFRVGCLPTTALTSGCFYAVRMYPNITGSGAVADVDFRTQTDLDTSFVGSAGETWTVNAGAELVGRDYRHHGEISEWPVGWDQSGRDCFVPVTSADVFRRLSKGRKALRSVYYRSATSAVSPFAGLVAFWACEETDGATVLAPAVGAAATPMAFVGGTPSLATDSASFACSGPLPTFNGAALVGSPGVYTSTGNIQIRMLLKVPAGGVASNCRLMTFLTSGTARRWNILVLTNGHILVEAFDAGGAQVVNYDIAFAVNGLAIRVGIGLRQDGSDVVWDVSVTDVNAGSASGLGDTLAGHTADRMGSFALNPDHVLTDTVFGGMAVQTENTSIFELFDQLTAYTGETATDRIERLCAEEGLTAVVLGGGTESPPMGAQRSLTLPDLLHECETADGGIMTGTRDRFGVLYRGRTSMDSQRAAITLSRTGGDLSSFAPTDDDQQLLNDLTVTRQGGSFARYTLDSGPLSVQDPPDGVGLYDASLTLNLESDAQLPDAASWRVHLGTADLPRLPAISVDLSRPVYQASSAKRAALSGIEVGDQFDIVDQPVTYPPDDMPQLVIGVGETITPFRRVLSFACRPARPWQVARYSDGARYSGPGTVTAEALDTTETGVDITNPSTHSWGHADGDFDIVAGGERMTVTAVSGTGTSQTLTVTRSVNGIVKSHSAGAAVSLADPSYYGM